MKLNIIKVLITTLLLVSVAFALLSFIPGAHAATTIDPQIKFAHGVLGEFHVGSQELVVIFTMIVPALLIYLGIFIDTLKN